MEQTQLIKKQIINKCFLITGIFIRIFYFFVNIFVGGYHADETMTTLNAYSIASKGTDILNNKYPIYFATWIRSGQSPIATYLSALSVKLFGETIWAVRLPMLIISILGLLVVYLFLEEVFNNEKIKVVTMALFSISPWMIFASTYVLDCNYLVYMMIFAYFFLVKAINTQRIKHYILSMFFFSMCLYSYIASVIMIPIVLLMTCILLYKKKMVNIKQILFCVISFLLFSSLFILHGLVSLDMLPSIKIWKISISHMEGYERSDTLVFSTCGNFITLIANMTKNFILAMSLIIANDFNYSVNSFLYGNCFSCLFIIIGTTKLIYIIRHKQKTLNTLQKILFVNFMISAIIFCSIVEPSSSCVYRYGTLTFYLIFIEAIGFIEFFNILSKVSNIFITNKILILYCMLSLGVFSILFYSQYRTQVKQNSIYGDSFYNCMSYLENEEIDTINIVNSNYILKERISIYLRFYYGTDNFINYKDEYALRDSENDIKISTDSAEITVIYNNPDSMTELTQNCYVINKYYSNLYDYSNYKCIDFNTYILAIKI